MCVLKLVEGKKETDLAREIGANAARLPLAGYEQMKRGKKEIKKGSAWLWLQDRPQPDTPDRD